MKKKEKKKVFSSWSGGKDSSLACYKTGLFVAFSVFLVLISFWTICGGSEITKWNSVTEDNSSVFSVDIGMDVSKEVEFTVSSDLDYDWTWSVNEEEIKESEGESTELSYVFDEYGIYNVCVEGEGETVQAYWNVTVSLVIEEENDVRELEGLEDYTLRILNRPERIVSMAPSATEILFAIGAGDSVVGVTDFCDYPQEVEEKKDEGKIKSVGGYSTPIFEKIVDLEPDVIVSAYGNPDDVIPRLIELGYPVYAQNPKSFEEIFTHIKVTGAVTKCNENASSLVNSLRADLEEIEEKTELLEEEQRPRVYYAMGSIFYTSGEGTFQHDVIETAGGKNIAAEYLSSWGPFSIEYIVEEDPQVIIYSSHGSESLVSEQIKSAELKTVDAVKNNRIYPIDEDEISRTGPRLVNATQTVYGYLSEFFEEEEEGEEEEEEKEEERGEEEEKTVIKAGEERTIELEDECLRNITIKAKEDVEFTNVSLNISKELKIPQHPAIVYRYLNFSADNLTGSVEWLKLNFRVNESWIAANADNNTTAISLFCFDCSNYTWTEQNTSKTGEGNDKVYYRATSSSFGTFAICTSLKVKSVESQTSAPEAAVTPSPTSMPAQNTPIPTATHTQKPSPTETETPETSGFEAVFGIAGLLVAAYLVFVYRRER